MSRIGELIMASILNKGKDKSKTSTALALTEQAKESTALVQAVVDANLKTVSDRLDEEDAKINKLLASATEIAETLSEHAEFNEFAHDAIIHKQEDDYKSIRCYNYMKRYLSSDQRALMPWPKTKPDDHIVKTSNFPDVFDVLKTKRKNAKGEIVAHTTSFYRSLAEALPEGAQARDTLLGIEKVEGNTIDAPQEWKTDKQGNSIGKPRLEAAKAQCRTALNTLTDAMRKAGHIILQEHAISMLPRVRMTWTTDELNNIVKSTKPLSLVSRRPDKAGTPDEYDFGSTKSFSIGQMLSWKVDKAKKVAPHNQVTLDSLVASSKGVGKPGTSPPAPLVASARFKVSNITEAEDALNGFRSWYQGANPLEAQQHYSTLMELLKNDDSHADSFLWIFDALAPHANAPGFRERVQKYRDGLKAKNVA
jgi:hypothetical protein